MLTHKTFIKSETHTAHKQFGTLSCWTLYIVHTHTSESEKLGSVSEPIVQCHVYQGGDQMQNCIVSINQMNDTMSLRRELQKFQPKVRLTRAERHAPTFYCSYFCTQGGCGVSAGADPGCDGAKVGLQQGWAHYVTGGPRWVHDGSRQQLIPLVNESRRTDKHPAGALFFAGDASCFKAVAPNWWSLRTRPCSVQYLEWPPGQSSCAAMQPVRYRVLMMHPFGGTHQHKVMLTGQR